MRILLVTGNHPRHGFIARSIAATGWLCGLVIEKREAFVPEPPPALPSASRELFNRHFAGRERSESRFFSTSLYRPEEIPTLEVTSAEINGQEVQRFLLAAKPDLLLSYGIQKLSDAVLASVEGLRWNIHGGLSPWYRGVITHFWPSYFLEPQMTGMTVHELTTAIDGGDIIHQVVAPLVAGDGLHDLACRAVTALGDELPELLAITYNHKLAPPAKQRTTGRIWRALDWRPEHLHVIYNVFNNRIVDHYLAGDFATAAPKVVRQF